MPDAKRPLRIVPTPMVDDGSGYRRPARCPLCCELLTGGITVWDHLPSDPPDLRRVFHARCFLFYRATEGNAAGRSGRITPAY